MIGEHLKEIRIAKNISQEEMTAGIIDRSFYSRIENGRSAISTDDLMRILYNYELSIVEFLQNCGDTEPKLENYQDQITAAYLHKDIALLQKMRACVKFEDPRVKELISFLINELKGSATLEQFKKLKHSFLKSNKWDEETMWLLFHIMCWYEFTDLQNLIDMILKQFNPQSATDRMQELVVRIAIRYLDICLKQNTKNYECEKIIQLIKVMPNSTKMRMYKIITVYYDKLLHHCYDEADDIASLLIKM